MATHVLFDSVDSVVRNFLRAGKPFYIVADSKNESIWINDNESDLDSAAQMLRDDLSSIRDYNTAIFTIKHFASVPNKGGLKKTTEPDQISTFKKGFSEEARNDYMSTKMSGIHSQNAILEDLRSKLVSLETKLDILENGEDEQELENAAQPANGSIQNMLGKVLELPNVQHFINNIFANIVTNTLPKTLAGEIPNNNMNQQQPETLETILERLFSKKITIEDLQKLSLMDQSKIDMMLNILRSN